MKPSLYGKRTDSDLVVRSDLDRYRFHLVEAVVDRVPKLGHIAAYASRAFHSMS
jgi:phosphoketolase